MAKVVAKVMRKMKLVDTENVRFESSLRSCSRATR